MPSELELTPNKTKVNCILKKDGVVLKSLRFDPLSPLSQKNCSRALGVSSVQLLNWAEEVKTSGNTKTIELGVVPTEPIEFIVREFEQKPGDGERIVSHAKDLLTTRLPVIPVDRLLTWTDLGACCCLDVDYHETKAPERVLLESVVLTRITPRPFCWHFSRGGGLHLFYIGQDGFTAEELASVAALRFRIIDATAGVELKHQVRGPGSEPVTYSGEQDTTGLLLDWLREPGADETGLAEYLEEHNYEIGRRYPHEHCPIAPSSDSGKHRDPVVVKEAGITCYLCEGADRVFGSRKAGWFPWSALLRNPTAGDLGHMVRKIAHWGHAKYVLAEKYGIRGELAEKAYSAALKAYHQGTPKALFASMIRSDDIDPLTRVGSGWMIVEQLSDYSKAITQILQTLPSVLYMDEGGKVKPKLSTVTTLLEGHDLTSFGYPPVQIIYGTKLAAQYLGQMDRTTVAVANPELRTSNSDRALPRYVPFSKRMKLDKAHDVIEQIVPGVDWPLVELIICGVGSAQETELGLPPRLFVTGPSGAAKSSHFRIAAGIVGVIVAEPTVQGNSDERLRQAIMEGIKKSPIIVINEIFKDAYRNNRQQKPGEALQPILNMEKESMTHVLYKGPQKFGRQFVLGLTEIALPLDIKDETQIARRIRYRRIERSRRIWEKTIPAAGLKELHMMRTLSTEVADACNAVLSDIIDRFFVEPLTFQTQADMLGIKTIQDSEDFMDHTPFLRRLFQLVCSAPEIDNQHQSKMFPRYKKISRGLAETTNPDDTDAQDAQELLALYTAYGADGPGTEWVTSRRLMEKDWGLMLGVDQPVKLMMGEDGNNVYLRFQVGSMKHPERVNQEIVDPRDWRTI